MAEDERSDNAAREDGHADNARGSAEKKAVFEQLVDEKI
jgi:hypothetical protein